MKAKIHHCKIMKKRVIAPKTIDLYLASKEISNLAKPGQFVSIKCTDSKDLILRRPFSICDSNPDKGLFRIIFQVRGKGTEKLMRYKEGDILDILGPLGNSFEIDKKYKNIIIAGGGIGVFPMLFLAKRSLSENITICLGFKNKEMMVLKEEFEGIADELKIATDNGTFGYRGYVTELVMDSLNDNVDIVYTCGPKRMMSKIKNMCINENIKSQFCLEERMGCGIGACLVCACKIKKKDSDDYMYSHVCKDGPVFWGNEVILDEW